MSQKRILLTIDDSPSSKFTELIGFLNSRNIKTVLFCRGDRIRGNENIMIHAIRSGHTLGNHSYSHPHFSHLTLEECFEEILKTDKLIQNLYQKAQQNQVKKVFRFPYGDKGDLKFGHHFWPVVKAFNHHQTRTKKYISTIRSFIYGRKYEYKLTSLGTDRKNSLQLYLQQLGYQQLNRKNITYHFIQPLLDDIDWPWTIDLAEWKYYDRTFDKDLTESILEILYSKNPPLGYGNIPENYGLPFPDSNDILLLHDHRNTLDVFTAAIDTLLDQGYQFTDPLL